MIRKIAALSPASFASLAGGMRYPPAMYVDRAVGIDLGTTNSEIALLHPSEREVILYADRFGRRTIPSAVAWDPKAAGGAGGYVVGHAARARRGKDPGPVESVKRKMGQRAAVKVGPHELLPEEVSAKILGELRDRMREHLASQAAAGVEMRVARAVVTVPAYFDAPQVEATRRAGELAGLDTRVRSCHAPFEHLDRLVRHLFVGA